MSTRTIAINDIGRRVGDSHHNAKLTNSEVDMLLEMHEQGMGYGRLSAKFEVSKSLVRDICKGKSRCQTPTDWRVLK